MTDASGFRMVDVGAKPITRRRALASGRLRAKASTIARILTGDLPKGDALRLAEIAGISGAKRCADLLPLCHPLPIDSVRVSLAEAPGAGGAREIEARCEVLCHAKTGAEMEALAGVQAALLCVWDLAKAIDPELEIGGIRLLEKEGGKSGHWVNSLATTDGSAPSSPESEASNRFAGLRVSVLTVSDRCSRGEAEDRTGPRITAAFREEGAVILTEAVVPDEIPAIRERLRSWLAIDAPEAIVLTGGTGASPRDVTPEALAPLWTRVFPGFGETFRRKGAASTPFAWISRAEAGLVGSTLVFVLPGSRGAVEDGLEILRETLPHLREMLRGGAHR